MNNPWDSLSQYFDTGGNKEEISSGAADNILIAWPVILQFLQDNFPKDRKGIIIDFGCGGGGFANKLHSLVYQVIGIDASEEMIKIANKLYGKEISFKVGDHHQLTHMGKVACIASIMSLQFIGDIDAAMSDFSKALIPNGLLIFAVFNPEYVVNGLKAKLFFEDFDSTAKPTKGIANFSGIRIPTYIRTAKEYTGIVQKYGFKCLLESYPPFTEEFIKKYPTDMPTDKPEYLILGYQRI